MAAAQMNSFSDLINAVIPALSGAAGSLDIVEPDFSALIGAVESKQPAITLDHLKRLMDFFDPESPMPADLLVSIVPHFFSQAKFPFMEPEELVNLLLELNQALHPGSRTIDLWASSEPSSLLYKGEIFIKRVVSDLTRILMPADLPVTSFAKTKGAESALLNGSSVGAGFLAGAGAVFVSKADSQEKIQADAAHLAHPLMEHLLLSYREMMESRIQTSSLARGNGRITYSLAHSNSVSLFLNLYIALSHYDRGLETTGLRNPMLGLGVSADFSGETKAPHKVLLRELALDLLKGKLALNHSLVREVLYHALHLQMNLLSNEIEEVNVNVKWKVLEFILNRLRSSEKAAKKQAEELGEAVFQSNSMMHSLFALRGRSFDSMEVNKDKLNQLFQLADALPDLPDANKKDFFLGFLNAYVQGDYPLRDPALILKLLSLEVKGSVLDGELKFETAGKDIEKSEVHLSVAVPDSRLLDLRKAVLSFIFKPISFKDPVTIHFVRAITDPDSALCQLFLPGLRGSGSRKLKGKPALDCIEQAAKIVSEFNELKQKEMASCEGSGAPASPWSEIFAISSKSGASGLDVGVSSATAGATDLSEGVALSAGGAGGAGAAAGSGSASSQGRSRRGLGGVFRSVLSFGNKAVPAAPAVASAVEAPASADPSAFGAAGVFEAASLAAASVSELGTFTDKREDLGAGAERPSTQAETRQSRTTVTRLVSGAEPTKPKGLLERLDLSRAAEKAGQAKKEAALAAENMRVLAELRARADTLNPKSEGGPVCPEHPTAGRGGLGLAVSGSAGASKGAGSDFTSVGVAAPGFAADLRAQGVFASGALGFSDLARRMDGVSADSVASVGGAPATEASRTGKSGVSLLRGWGRKGRGADSSTLAESPSPGGASGKPSGPRSPFDKL